MKMLKMGAAIITGHHRHFQVRQAEIARRFRDMTAHLPEPYSAFTLPDVVTTASVLAR